MKTQRPTNDYPPTIAKQHDKSIYLIEDPSDDSYGWSSYMVAESFEEVEEREQTGHPPCARLDMHHLMKMMTALDHNYQWQWGAAKELWDLEMELSNICAYSATKTQNELCLRFIELKSKVRSMIKAYGYKGAF